MINTNEKNTRYVQISNQIKVGEHYRFFRVRVVSRFNAKKNLWVKDYTQIEYTERHDFSFTSPSYWNVSHEAHIPESALRSISSIKTYVKKHPEFGFIYEYASASRPIPPYPMRMWRRWRPPPARDAAAAPACLRPTL